MLFNSIEFIFFFPIVVLLYFFSSHKYRWIVLLLSSYVFYMAWEPAYILLILSSTIVDYFAARLIARETQSRIKLRYLLVSLCMNLGLLFAFKYYNFFSDNLRWLFSFLEIDYSVPDSNLLLPVGISFYTFQTLSYTIEVYRGKQPVEKHFGRFALYVAFFPQLVAGPIERAWRLLPQFKEKKDFDYARITSGLKLMTWGFFKKLVIADRLSYYVNEVYADPGQSNGISILVATVFFAYQIYCDFSGYCDIAIGAARVMGFDLMQNFNRPYYSKSISEFWQRWHISLSTWFKDYVYIPLGGNRVRIGRWYFNLLVVFLVSGLWHGANWTFVIWGGLHGFYMVFSHLSSGIRTNAIEVLGLRSKPDLLKVLRVFTVFSLVCFSWIFFRASSVQDALTMIGNIAGCWNQSGSLSDIMAAFTLNRTVPFLLSVISILLLEIYHWIERKNDFWKVLSEQIYLVRWSVYYGLIFAIIVFGVFDESSFIYFQF